MRKKKEDTNGVQTKAQAQPKPQSRSRSKPLAKETTKKNVKDVGLKKSKIAKEKSAVKKMVSPKADAKPKSSRKRSAKKVKGAKTKTARQAKQVEVKKAKTRAKRKSAKTTFKPKLKSKANQPVTVKGKQVQKNVRGKKTKGKNIEVISVIARRIQESKRIKPSKRFSEPLEYVCKRCKQSVELFIPAKVMCSRCGKAMQIHSEVETNVEPLAKAA